MLYDCWRQIARDYREEAALIDLSSGKHWTFQALAAAAESGTEPCSTAVFPQGISDAFVLSVLRGWRCGAVVCPLEEGQTPLALSKTPTGCVHLKTTSASTGLPRLIAFTAEQSLADVSQIVATMGLRRDWPNLGVISLAHSYGFSNLVLPLLLHGIPLLLANSPLPESVRRAGSLVPNLTLAAVPALWRAWVDAKAVPENVRLAISAGAPLPLSLEQEAFERLGLKIHNFYGASECGGIAYDATTHPRDDATCVGSPMRDVNLSLDDEGCLRVRSRAAGLTYWPVPATNLRDGCYQTSDLASLDHGLVYLRGRQSDLINVAGRKVSPESIERALATHPQVRECLVFGVPSPDLDRTEVIVACVVSTATLGSEIFKQHLLSQLPAWQVPRDWWFVPRLEANQRGKLARAEWRQKYLDGRESRPDNDCSEP
jgi:long-chain acyl-CoA synthetase